MIAGLCIQGRECTIIRFPTGGLSIDAGTLPPPRRRRERSAVSVFHTFAVSMSLLDVPRVRHCLRHDVLAGLQRLVDRLRAGDGGGDLLRHVRAEALEL